eukprot:TRINITY_DN4131_c0_g1_i1.p1 TRINITY_DN4131_c0_g1~~TRINITY_DN4131_c0_g1_i1.p1  ORF type:complete len:442 (-),score=76.22 TRINITY_DN4131_c0_g1_i1:9-1334(-)
MLHSVGWKHIIRPLEAYLQKAIVPGEPLKELKAETIAFLLQVKDAQIENALRALSNSITERFFGNKVFFRGIVEFSNVCQKNCFYCGIRRDINDPLSGSSINTPGPTVVRYTMRKQEIVDCALSAYQQQFGSLMLQSGEIVTEERLAFLEDVIRTIRQQTVELEKKQAPHSCVGNPNHLKPSHPIPHYGKGLAVALSVGELDAPAYQRLFAAGAHRYLLRIETSNPALYSSLHPHDSLHRFHNRVNCLKQLKAIGFQLGTGVMIGLLGQTVMDLANDLLFFRSIRADMIGMGPYIVARNTPLAERYEKELDFMSRMNTLTLQKDKVQLRKKWQDNAFNLSIRMIMLARILLGNINISATTALQVLNPSGREIALSSGANVVMPILTPQHFRERYTLYGDKGHIDEGVSLKSSAASTLNDRVTSIGKRVVYGDWGDPLSYFP